MKRALELPTQPPPTSPEAAERLWLLEQVESHYGVQRRTRAFFEALQDPASPVAALIEDARALMLADFVFWSGLAEAPRALAVLAAALRPLSARADTPALKERLLRTSLELAQAIGPLTPAESFRPVLHQCLALLAEGLKAGELVTARASGWLASQGGELAGDERCAAMLESLLREALHATYDFFGRTADLELWYASNRQAFDEDPTPRFRRVGRAWLERLKSELEAARGWSELKALPGFDTLLERYATLFDDAPSALDRARYGLFLAEQPAFALLRRQLLGGVARALKAPLPPDACSRLSGLFDELFACLSRLDPHDRPAALACVAVLARSIHQAGDAEALADLQRRLLAGGLGGHPAGPAQCEEVRVWLEIIGIDPPSSAMLLAGLAAHLRVHGLLMQDTQFLQRDFSQLLNARIEPVYKLVLQLARSLPIFFEEIGADGELREVSARIDQVAHREDPLVHFVRKQVHSESSSRQVALVEEVLHFWQTGETEHLLPLLPPELREKVRPEGRWFEPVHRAVTVLGERLGCRGLALLRQPAREVAQALDSMADLDAVDRERVACLLRLHVLLRRKYALDADGALPQMRRLQVYGSLVRPGEVEALQELLAQDDPRPALQQVLALMARLREVVLDPTPTQGEERLYRKRHIADGIMSIYGSYYEPKFAALGFSLRLESLATQLLGRLIERTPLETVSRGTMRQIASVLAAFQTGLRLVGAGDESLDAHLRMLDDSLKASSASLAQFANIFQFLAADVKRCVHEDLVRHYDEPLRLLFASGATPPAGRKPSRPAEGGEIERFKRAEEFYRGMIASSFLVGLLDQFIAAVLDRLNAAQDKLSPEVVERLLTFDLELASSPLDEPTPHLDSPVFLGGKGYLLKRLNAFGFQVPPGFVVTTEVFRVRDVLDCYPDLKRSIAEVVRRGTRELERKTGKRLGDPARPLLLSVRSGAAISMPGVMSTFLNVGLNEEIVEGLSRQPNYGWTSWDCYRRSLQTWGMAYGIPRDAFDQTITEFKTRWNVKAKVDFTPAQMRLIALAYRDLLREHHVHFETDPERQILQAVTEVLRSWDSPRADVYRRRLGIAESWGTAAIVQAMVLGNIGYDSGTGVVFTCEPDAVEAGVSLYGDFTTTSQGEDVVAGLVHPWPVSKNQLAPGEEGMTLQTHFPAIYDELLARAKELVEERNLGHQEIEFTFESSRREDLYFLQTREYRGRREDVERPTFVEEPPEESRIGRGIGVGGGALSGRIAFDLLDLMRLSREHPDGARVLVRPDTVPDDIALIFECEGLLTARGGATSHAAVTAGYLGKTCVVNCRALVVDDQRKRCMLNGVELKVGDLISIDGHSGQIYRGAHPISRPG